MIFIITTSSKEDPQQFPIHNDFGWFSYYDANVHTCDGLKYEWMIEVID